MISLFAEKENEQATMALYEILKDIRLPNGISISINNIREGKSGLLRENGKVVDISLANCYSMEDVVRELVVLLATD